MRTLFLSLTAALTALGALPSLAEGPLPSSVGPVSGDRPRLDLSGEWEFKLDPDDVGRAERYFEASVAYDRKIAVPGAWNAQGVAYPSEPSLRAYEKAAAEEHQHLYGLGTLGKQSESAKLDSVYPGPAWYRKRVTIPLEWKDKVPWLVFGGVHREAEVWVNGQSVGSHNSYLTPFRIDLSNRAKADDTITVAVRVDARRNRARDPLMGCFDTLDFLYITWGGLYRPVTLEATERDRFGDIFILPRLADSTAEMRIHLEGPRPGAVTILADAADAEGSPAASAKTKLVAGEADAVLQLPIVRPRLWSPTSPHLYTARLSLLDGERTVDARSIRFGMREFQVAGGKFLLNGQPIFLRGYGDDCIFPTTICPPADKALLKQRLAAARSYGFNYVRHHSWIPPEEYLEAADELGMMLQPEFPFAYRWDLPTTPEAKQAALDQWQAIIRLHRNHPSIVTWCMGNELYDSFDLAPEMYRLAKQLDPTRPVVDSDGCNFSHQTRNTLDFMVVQFGEGHSIGFNDGKYDFGQEIRKPVIAHEMGYFVTLPDLAQFDQFGSGLRPYWLTQARDLAAHNGMASEYPAWLASSYRLQATCFKSNMEAARRLR
ncbi:MAG: glycoside hydrolase family 2 TIM barrel-domain containing protein [Verrucomicrobiota bacterium]